MKKKDVYYHHELTQYLNGSDSVSVYEVKKCKDCSFEQETLILEESFPVNNNDSYQLKKQMLSILKANKVKSKDEYILQRTLTGDAFNEKH